MMQDNSLASGALLLLALLLSACRSVDRPALAATETPAATPTVPQDEHTFYVAVDGDDADPGTFDRPWATLHHAAEVLKAGETVYVRGGTYRINRQIRPKNSGTAEAWIVYAGYPGEQPVIDAHEIHTGPAGTAASFVGDDGAFQIQDVGYVLVKNLTLQNSHNAGFTIRDSHHVELVNNTTDTTFSSGIAAWDTDHDGRGCEHIKVIGNTVIHATTYDVILAGYPRGSEPPHEAISIAGARHFEVAYNHVYDCDKEGIDVKETSAHGTVHHNHVHDVERQGLYVDSWFGVLADVEFYENVVHDCQGAGFALSVEGGELLKDVRFHHNLLYDNLGTGIFFSRWGGDGLRTNVSIYNNTVHHNGYGPPKAGEKYFWMTGGLYFFSTNLQNVDVRNNIFSDNRGFQIGYSDRYLKAGQDVEAVFQEKNITVEYNLIFDRNDVAYPIYVGWPPDNYADVYALKGDHFVEGDPLFVDPQSGDLHLQRGSPAIDVGDPASDYADPDGTRNDIGAFYR